MRRVFRLMVFAAPFLLVAVGVSQRPSSPAQPAELERPTERMPPAGPRQPSGLIANIEHRTTTSLNGA